MLNNPNKQLDGLTEKKHKRRPTIRVPSPDAHRPTLGAHFCFLRHLKLSSLSCHHFRLTRRIHRPSKKFNSTNREL